MLAARATHVGMLQGKLPGFSPQEGRPWLVSRIGRIEPMDLSADWRALAQDGIWAGWNTVRGQCKDAGTGAEPWPGVGAVRHDVFQKVPIGGPSFSAAAGMRAGFHSARRQWDDGIGLARWRGSCVPDSTDGRLSCATSQRRDDGAAGAQIGLLPDVPGRHRVPAPVQPAMATACEACPRTHGGQEATAARSGGSASRKVRRS